MKCCINDVNFNRLLLLSTELFKFEFQKYGQILCAHKPYFLMPGHIYDLNSYITFTPNYYGDDKNLSILERVCHTRKRLYSVEDIARLLLHPSLSLFARKCQPPFPKEYHLLLN